jgi:hypothetical protein
MKGGMLSMKNWCKWSLPIVTSTSGLASASFLRIIAIRSFTLAAPGGCCGCWKSRGIKGLCVMPMMVTSVAMGYLL